jgi:two-component system, OmpR family, sensor histidine kinase KdpD
MVAHMASDLPSILRNRSVRLLPALAVWGLAWAAMLALDGIVDLANLAMLLVLASAVATLWLPAGLSMVVSTVSVLAFNWLFVPPRGTFAVDLWQHALLLAAMLVVSWIVAALMVRQRLLAANANRHAQQADQLRRLGEALRDTDEPLAQAGVLRDALAELIGTPVLMLMLKGALPANNDSGAATMAGEPDADQLAGLWLCLRQATPFGPGTGRHEEVAELYLPFRGRQASWGAAAIRLRSPSSAEAALQAHAQSLCDQMGLALQRAQTLRAAAAAREQAQTQGVRNALLAAISHDYRTPLANIMSAASSLAEQGERLASQQRQRLAASIVDEAGQLSRLTDNTLQLARLDAPGVQLQMDWESAEEIVGAVLSRARRHDPQRRVRARLEPSLPLLHGDALLLTQMLDNLVDNALKYSPDDAPVEVLARRQGEHIVLAVRDRGPGVAPAWRERIFEVFHRGAAPAAADSSARPERSSARGAGVGLAVCRAIARAHGGELELRTRSHGGCSFECWLPAAAPPPADAVTQPTA